MATGLGGKGGKGKGKFGGDDGSIARKAPKILSNTCKPDVQQVLGQFAGTIKSFNPTNGFGFIHCDDLKAQGYQNDVYMHHSQIGDFQPGQQVMFTAYLNKKGQPQSMDLQALVS
mmetsp:Transcript_127714/g.284687  ORF Transcript_127714/g.284687 Transcript_127714/m.284687 type:complete len:115 (-) Transcript_127714:12-356(-)